jgi:ABC-type amino acid transport substrate-binding protein
VRPAPAVPPAAAAAGARLETIRRSGVLRIGYLDDALPYAFVNRRGALVGLDVALMHRLARELGVRLEFAPIDRQALDSAAAPGLLRSGACDLLIGGLAVTTERAGAMRLSSPYLDETMALMVPDGERRRYDSWQAIAAAGRITIAVPDVPYYVELLHARLPDANLHRTEHLADLFTPGPVQIDAFALPAERGSAWTLRYPQYSVVVPSTDPIKVPLAIAMPIDEAALATFLDTWIELKRRDGTIEALYRIWILGRDDGAAAPRWSIIRNVLHWVR